MGAGNMPNAPRHYRPYTLPPQPTPPRPDTRPTAAARGYDAAWAKLRNWYARQHPICQWPGCTQPMGIVDHIIPITDGGPRLDASNLQSLCRSHHGVKTARDIRCR